MENSFKDLEFKYGDLKDSIKMYKMLQGEHVKKETFNCIMLKSVELVVELLFFIIRRQH